MNRVCVFTGSHMGTKPAFAHATRELGRALVDRNLGLVYGGATVGLMGLIADTVLEGGGEVVGVIPEALESKEIAHRGLTELRVVGSMHERKAEMAALSDAFIALPGGFGTLDELFEIATWRQLGLHDKPLGLVNVDGYFDALLAFADRATEDGFVRPQHRALLECDASPGTLLELLVGRSAKNVSL